METRNRYHGVDRAVVDTVRVHARRLARSRTIPAAGVDDLEQELMIGLLRRLPRFDPRRAALPTFADRVVRHRVAALTEAARAAKRGGDQGMISLEDAFGPFPEGGADATLERLAAGEGLWAEIPAPLDEAVGLRRDLERFVRDLPEPLRRCCVWLLDGSISEASRRSGMPRASIYELIARLHRRCREAGLEIYLGRARRIATPSGK